MQLFKIKWILSSILQLIFLKYYSWIPFLKSRLLLLRNWSLNVLLLFLLNFPLTDTCWHPLCSCFQPKHYKSWKLKAQPFSFVSYHKCDSKKEEKRLNLSRSLWKYNLSSLYILLHISLSKHLIFPLLNVEFSSVGSATHIPSSLPHRLTEPKISQIPDGAGVRPKTSEVWSSLKRTKLAFYFTKEDFRSRCGSICGLYLKVRHRKQGYKMYVFVLLIQ